MLQQFGKINYVNTQEIYFTGFKLVQKRDQIT